MLITFDRKLYKLETLQNVNNINKTILNYKKLMWRHISSHLIPDVKQEKHIDRHGFLKKSARYLPEISRIKWNLVIWQNGYIFSRTRYCQLYI